MNIDSARQAAANFIASRFFMPGEELILDPTRHFEIDDAVVFPCNSRAFFEEGGEPYVGALPVRVDKRTGECRFLTLNETLAM